MTNFPCFHWYVQDSLIEESDSLLLLPWNFFTYFINFKASYYD